MPYTETEGFYEGMRNDKVIAGIEASSVGPDDGLIDFGREQAAYERERERLVREYRGWIALIHGDEVAGAFRSADEAILEAFRRFGTDQVMLNEIRDPDLPDFVPLANPEHPSFRKVS